MPVAEPQRLSKIVAAAVPCSRREAEQYIAEGWVRVDGVKVEEPQTRVAEGRRVDIDPKAKLQPPVSATFLFHKPAGMRDEDAMASLRADSRWSGDATGIRRVKSHDVGLVPLLPLPREASGLAVYSQDRRIVRKLTEDAMLVEQELTIDVTGVLVPAGFEQLARGTPPARVSWQSEARLRFAAKGIAPHKVPALCEQIGLRVTALRRIRIGRIAMAGMGVGQWRYLAVDERF